MPSEITMPQLSDTMSEGKLVKWNRREGDKVKAGEEIAEIETDKATMPMESFEAGTLALLAVNEGEKVKVGSLLAVIALAGEDAAAIKKQYQSAPKQPAPAAAPAMKLGTSNDAETDHPKLEQERTQARHDQIHTGTHIHPSGESVEQYATADAAKGAPGGEGRRLRISPLARRMAIENHIDPTRIPGSGPGGRIIQRDVMAFVGSGASPKGADGGSQRPARSRQTAPAKPAGPQIQPGQTQVVAMSKMRSAIASALQRSKQQVPHFYETVDVDADQLTKVRESLNQRLESQNIRLSLADLIYKAVATALTQHPAVNARYNPEKNEITRYGDVNLGIAVAIPDGLIVPVLRGVNRMDLKTIRQQGADLIERARAQRLRREEQSEATFTISNLGNYGIREFSAIINPPEVAILAVGSAEKRAVVRFDSIVPRTMMTLTLSADHRAVDGATAAEFMRTLKATLEEPGLMLE